MTEGPCMEWMGELYGIIRLQLKSWAKHKVLQVSFFPLRDILMLSKEKLLVSCTSRQLCIWNTDWWWERVKPQHNAGNMWVRSLAGVVSEPELVVWVWCSLSGLWQIIPLHWKVLMEGEWEDPESDFLQTSCSSTENSKYISDSAVSCITNSLAIRDFSCYSLGYLQIREKRI